MKHPEDDWSRDPHFPKAPPEPMPIYDGPPEDCPEECREDDTPEFAAIRRIELLGRLHHMAFRTLFRKDGLPPAQAGAMKVVIRFPGLSQRELADKLHIQRATATVMLQKMEKAGYIDRRPDQDDQRISRIYPTALSLTIDGENQKTVSAYFLRCFEGVSPQEFEILEKALTRVTENLRDILSENPDPNSKE